MLASISALALREARDQLLSRRMGTAGFLCALLVAASMKRASEAMIKGTNLGRIGPTKGRSGVRHQCIMSALARGLEAHNGRLLFITWSQPRRQLTEMEGAVTRTKSSHIRQRRREVQWGKVCLPVCRRWAH